MIDNSRRGFTLIEILVVVAIFASLGTLMVNSLFSILRSNVKSELIKEIRQSGSFAIDVMTKKITGGTDPECADDYRGVSFNDVNGEKITFLCDSGGYIASQSASGKKTPLTGQNKITLTSCRFDCELSGTSHKVTIKFTLSQAGTPIRQEEIAQQSFSKIILVRNQ